VLARLRISVPDRPGSLGLLATTIGSAGADIEGVDVLETGSGRALDDVFVQVRDSDHLHALQTAVADLAGVVVVGVQQPVPPTTGHADLELVDQVISRPDRALQTLVDGAPSALGGDWAAIIPYTDGEAGPAVAVSGRGPAADTVNVRAALRLTTIQLTPDGSDRPAQGAVLVPLGQAPAALLLVRQDGPPFHQRELWRLGQLGNVVGSVLPTN
jgi:hypothetical protein